MSVSQVEIGLIAQPEPGLSAHANGEDAVLDIVDMTVLACLEEVQMEDEPDLIVELIDLYLDDAPHQIALMQKAVAEAEEKTLRRTAHGLKGSSANLGVRRVAALCEELERADCHDSFEKACLLLDRVEQEFTRARAIFLAERQRRV